MEGDEIPIDEEFPDETLFEISKVPWFGDIANFKVSNYIPHGWTHQQRKKLLSNAKFFVWDEPFLFKWGIDGLLHRCVLEEDVASIL